MTLDISQYTGNHQHPMDPTVVEFVAYERIDGQWDVFALAPPGDCLELAAPRYDDHHIFIEQIQSLEIFNSVVAAVELRLGSGYQRSPYYCEKATRKVIQKILEHLKQRGANGMWVRATSDDEWTLYIRNKDFQLADEIVHSNVG